MMLSLTLYSPLEHMTEEDIKKWYHARPDMSFTWSCLSPWAKGKWTGLFWKEKGID
jgi:hypothetical protein